MATDLENLQTARSNLLAALATNGHKRDYTIDGQQVSNSELWDRLEKVNAQISAIEGPFELIDRGCT